jgi:regulator of sigma E protease
VRLRDGSLRTRQDLAQALVRLEPPRLGLLEPGRPAIRAGLEPGDLILRANGDTVRSWNDVLHTVWRSPGTPIRFDVLRDGTVLQITVVPETRTERDTASPRPPTYGAIGAGQDPPTVHVRERLDRAVVTGFEETVTRTRIVLGFLRGLALGQMSARDVGGPILVGQISGQVARLGFDWFLTFMAFFSVNLAILNLLPIPILDGGQILFLLIEAVRRKPLSVAVRVRLTRIGFAVLLGIMALAIANDVLRVLPR